MSYLPEPPYRHGMAARIGVLLVNLGTPDAPTAAAVRPYLRQFLSDPRVVELPRALWGPILHGVVLLRRPRQSAQKYAKIWTQQGSPLKVHTERQAQLLHRRLAERYPEPIEVAWAMRYGSPSIAAGLQQLREHACDRVLVLPLYPQFAASTTASTWDAVFAVLARSRNPPALRVVKHFHDAPGYIAALAQNVREHWAAHGPPDHFVMSFHGLPRASLARGDPYHCECQKTGRLLAAELGLAPERYIVTFQSRFGYAEWLKPYTMDTVTTLGKRGTRRIDVVCPGFVADCLETLEEIAIENRAAFLASGGAEFHYIPCLNERDDWLAALADLAATHLQGWLNSGWDPARTSEEGAASRERALTTGARD
jgi:ferrochelatase